MIATLGLCALQRSAQGDRGYVPPGDVARIRNPAFLLGPLCAGGLVALLVFRIVWPPPVGGLGSGR